LAKQTTFRLKLDLDLQVSLSTVSLVRASKSKYRRTEEFVLFWAIKIFLWEFERAVWLIFTMKDVQQQFDISI